MKPTPQDPESGLVNVSSRVAALDPGMYIFRYASNPPAEKRVAISLQQAPLGKGVVDFFPAEGVSKNTLTKLGDCVVARVRGGATSVLISEFRLPGQKAGTVDLRIDRIDTSAAIMRPSADSAASYQPVVPAKVRVAGHIERVGDVIVGDEWLGNPHGTARLEGFAVHWDNKPAGVELTYQCKVRGIGTMAPVRSGEFAGTRGKAAPISAVTFSLTGPQSDQYRLEGQIAFAGCAPQTIQAGQEIAGTTGNEQLVALKLSILPKNEILAPRYKSPWEDPAVTQIYVAKQAEGQSA